MDFFGLRAVDELPTDDFKVLPDNQPSAKLFYACGTQWRFSATGSRLGLDYAAVSAAAQFLGFTVDTELFDNLRLIEMAALGARPDFPELERYPILTVRLSDDE